jgi:predicted DNA-binding transcriptional regulator YafY
MVLIMPSDGLWGDGSGYVSHTNPSTDSKLQQDFEKWMHIFEIFNTARVINDTLIKSSSNVDYIDFDRSGQYLKNEILAQMLSAIVDRHKIQFKHKSYWNEEVNTFNFYPHLLKQYQNRWYVFGCFTNGDFRSLGLERIWDLEVSSEIFKPKMKHPKDAFNDVIGLVYSISNVENVILSYDSFQGNYIKSQPLHSSQKILIDDENELRIQIKVKPNYELEEQILKQGERVKVLEPESLKLQIKKRLMEALGKY